jgi:hypothetical protein
LQQQQQQYQQHAVNSGPQQQQSLVGQQLQYRQLNNNGGMGNNVNGNGGGFGGSGYGGTANYNGSVNGNGYSGGYSNNSNGSGYGNGYNNGDRHTERRPTPYEMGQEYGRQQSGFGRDSPVNSNGADGYNRGMMPENTQLAETDRLVMRPVGLPEPVVPQPGQQRQRLGSKRGACNTSTEFSPPRTRQRQ